MSDLVFFRDKATEFKCQVQINGADIHNSFVRLCLEFKENNYYYKGRLNEDGSCIFKIPKLKQIHENEGQANIEVVADSTYFNVFKSGVKIKNAVTVEFKMQDIEYDTNVNEKENKKPIEINEDTDTNSKVSLTGIFINEENLDINETDKITTNENVRKINNANGVPIFSQFMKHK